MSGGDLADLVVQAGAVAGSLGVIVGAVLAVVRYTVLRPLTQIVEDRVGNVEATVDRRLRSVEGELRSNGGSSLNDAIRRIEKKVDSVNFSLTAYEARTSTFIRAQTTELERQEVATPDPHDFGIT